MVDGKIKFKSKKVITQQTLVSQAEKRASPEHPLPAENVIRFWPSKLHFYFIRAQCDLSQLLPILFVLILSAHESNNVLSGLTKAPLDWLLLSNPRLACQCQLPLLSLS